MINVVWWWPVAWLRIGDNSITNPRLLRLYELQIDGITRNAVFGFLVGSASLAAAHLTDYVVSYGNARVVGGDDDATAVLLDLCERAELMERITVDGTAMWKIPDDPEFIHMRTREEIEWERQRKSDNANPELVIPVRLRDGDGCRYCGQVVNWKARKGRLRGTYDHRRPGQAATVDTMVVSCQGCNASRSDDPLADERHKLLSAPTRPYYSAHTRDWIANHEWARSNGYSIDTRRGRTLPPGTVPDDRQAEVDRNQAAHAAATPDAGSQPAPTTTTTAPQPAAPHPAADPQPVGERAPVPPPRPADPHPVGGRDQAGPTPRPAAPPDAGERDHAADRHPAGERAPTPPAAPTASRENATVTLPLQPGSGPATSRGHAPTPPPPPAPTPDLLYPADPAEARSTGSGKSGSGRDGSGRVGSQTRTRASGPGTVSPRRRSRRRSSRSRT
ncbi:hypothetical protein [Tomitella cavernea]|uniref:HNH endonuclease n=1 Tax=Tomitella cavernea TaxID=1387982 RepID=A0ABP9CKY6_9ACTN|nr:hypothetical protein [Tomitella cavernea]